MAFKAKTFVIPNLKFRLNASHETTKHHIKFKFKYYKTKKQYNRVYFEAEAGCSHI